ncbi:MAG: hypothetical protein QCH34_05855 [Methanocalculus sp.]|nr:hypothetical protein [Methanocalculus sp.]
MFHHGVNEKITFPVSADLKKNGMLESDAYLDVRFSKAGVRLGKKLLARWEG